MRALYSLLLLVPAGLVARAADKDRPQPIKLTAEESAAGWLMLFDGDTTFGWKIKGPAKVKEHVLALAGNNKVAHTATTSAFRDFELRYDIDTGGQEVTVTFGNVTEVLKTNGWAAITVKRTGNQVDSESQGNVEATTRATGDAAAATPIRFEVPANATLQLRNVKLRPLGLTSIFNGKDLTGWKPIPDKKSTFAVTREGWLNIKNGPGDLQTEGQWDDFVLQLDVFSNGKHLNSGVFFRAIPGKFWSGYEAQIRNQWEGKDRSKPVDYGTGGIYNRQPARRVVSSDKEWFTMTVLAHGKHLAVWVNGYQTADFTDPRKVGDNARSGCKVAKGPISLQGHDPTTDLSFRNIQVAALPRKEGKN
jgi:hypothetical protein